MVALLGQTLIAQNIQLGAGFVSYDMGINLDYNSKYEVSPPELETTSILSIDIFTKIPLNKGFNIYPTLIFTMSKGTFIIDNLEGDFMPETSTVSLPYSTVGNGWTVDYFSDDYEYFLSYGSISQSSFGSFITKNLTKEFEIGSGIFLKSKKTEIENFIAYDEYLWSNSTGTQYDNYDYYDTHVSSTPFETETIKTTQISIPLMLQYTSYSDNYFIGGSFLAYIGQDTYYSIRMTMGFDITKK